MIAIAVSGRSAVVAIIVALGAIGCAASPPAECPTACVAVRSRCHSINCYEGGACWDIPGLCTRVPCTNPNCDAGRVFGVDAGTP